MIQEFMGAPPKQNIRMHACYQKDKLNMKVHIGDTQFKHVQHF